MRIAIDLNTHQHCLAYTRGGQTTYRMGDSLLTEGDPTPDSMKKFVKELLTQEDKLAREADKKTLDEYKNKDEEEDKDKPEGEGTEGDTEEGTEGEDADAEEGDADEGDDEEF